MWPNPQETEDFTTFTEEIFNGKLCFLGSVFDARMSNEAAVIVAKDATVVLQLIHALSQLKYFLSPASMV